jgi:hypothetical protein
MEFQAIYSAISSWRNKAQRTMEIIYAIWMARTGARDIGSYILLYGGMVAWRF